MKRTLTWLITLTLFLGSGLKVMAMNHTTSEQGQSLTLLQGTECKGDRDNDCQ